MNERRWSQSWLWLIVAMVCAASLLEAGASLIYTYTDEKGNFVATDSLANVPPKYRARVQTREVKDSGPSARSGKPSRKPRPRRRQAWSRLCRGWWSVFRRVWRFRD